MHSAQCRSLFFLCQSASFLTIPLPIRRSCVERDLLHPPHILRIDRLLNLSGLVPLNCGTQSGILGAYAQELRGEHQEAAGRSYRPRDDGPVGGRFEQHSRGQARPDPFRGGHSENGQRSAVPGPGWSCPQSGCAIPLPDIPCGIRSPKALYRGGMPRADRTYGEPKKGRRVFLGLLRAGSPPCLTGRP